MKEGAFMFKFNIKSWGITFLIMIITAAFVIIKPMIPDLFPKSTEATETKETEYKIDSASYDLSDIPDFTDKPYVVINNNEPKFTKEKLNEAKTSFQNFGDLDDLNRCTAAEASVGKDIMPTEERESIAGIKPTGWHTVRYDDIIEDKYLYNRCHLIGYQLTGQNDNEYNLITGTRYLNIEGMLPFENDIADYVRNTENHVLYRVTPIFQNDNLVASGVLMEAQSIEDNGKGIRFCIYAYNEQPGIIIDHKTGDSKIE